jgi:hypothetical protein
MSLSWLIVCESRVIHIRMIAGSNVREQFGAFGATGRLAGETSALSSSCGRDECHFCWYYRAISASAARLLWE